MFTKLSALSASLITLLSFSNLIQSFAEPQPKVLYEGIKDTINENIGNMTSYILVPVGVLVMIINILLILWSLLSGEKGSVGNRIGAIIVGFVMVAIGIFINSNKSLIFVG
jgi:hypothetical protein